MVLLQLSSSAQDLSSYEKWWFVQGGDTMPYRVLLPVDYDPARPYPVIFFLHGRGESGNDNQKQLAHGASLFLRYSIRDRFPAIVVFPQCAANSYWSNVETIIEGKQNGKREFDFVAGGEPTGSMKLLLSLVDNVIRRYPVNKEQVYVMGLSMGGMGTFELVRRKPKLFAAAVAICGGADPSAAKQLKHTNWWIFHGLKDDIVDPEFSKKMAEAIKDKGGKVKLTLYPNANHNSWDPAFREPDLLQWLFSQKK
jgi:predicted peptidase